MSTVDKELLGDPFTRRSTGVFACQNSLFTFIGVPQSSPWGQVSSGHLQPVDFATLLWSSEGEGQKSVLFLVTQLLGCWGSVHESIHESFLCSWGSREFVWKEHLWQERQHIVNSETSQL